MYDNLIARDKAPNSSIKETKSTNLGTNKSSLIQRAVSDAHNKGSLLHSNLSLNSSNEKKRPLSISSVSSSSSSSCSSLTRNGSYGLGDTKKSYLASIESLDDADEDTDDDSLGIIRMIRAKVNGCGGLNASNFQGGSVNQQSHNLSQTQSSQMSSNHSKTECPHEQQPTSLLSQHTKSCISTVNNVNCRNSTVPKYLDTNLSHIERVIVEIVETERTYVKDLQEIIEGYLKYMTSLDESRIKKEEISNLFSNIEDIYKFNSNFFSQLEECGLNAVSIAKCFIQNSSGFNIYTHYCTNYPRTVSLLTDMMRNTDRGELFKERQISLKHSLPLGSYLLKPVQRILKYHLLLQNIVKYTDKETNDYIDIKNALSVMTSIAYHINDMKRKHEHAVRVQEIQSLLYNWEGQDLTTYGDLQCEGSFRMFGAKAYRHLFLFDKMLLITKKKDEGILSYKTLILCSNLMLIESIQGEPLCFHAIPFDQPRAQYTFQARNLEQKREWCLLLKRVILENYNVVIPSHAKQIVMELGQSLHCDTEKSHSGSKRTLSAPEYLERRKQERRKSESTINQNLSKGFKLRKSLKKMHYMDSNGGRRARSSSHDESGRTLSKHEDSIERRSSLGVMELNSQNSSAVSGEKFESNTTNAVTTTPPKPVNQTGSAANDLTEEKAVNDVENQIDLSNNILDMRPPPRTFRIGQKDLNDVPNDTNGEYVTFYITANNHLDINEGKSTTNSISNSSSTLYNRTSTPLSSGSSELSMASSSQSEDSKYVVLPVNALLSYTNHSSSPIVRRVQSFTGMTRAKAILQHTLSLRHSLTSDLPPTSPNKRIVQRPTTLNLSNSSSSSQLPTSSSMDEMSPTAPAIWLKRQERHFANSDGKKGGSLPRSFESSSFAESNDDNSSSLSNRSRHTPHCEQRPFTIANDKPLNSDFISGSLERYIDIENDNQCLENSSSHDDILKCSDNSPSVSLENVSNNEVHHPEHKIYKHSASKYIRSMIYSVSSKLVSFRRSPTGSDHGGDNSSIMSGESGDRCESPAYYNRSNSRESNKANESKYEISPKLITARFVHTLAKAYSNIIKSKLKSSAKNEIIDISASKALSEIPSPVFARIAVPVNSAVTAERLASYDSEDCFDLRPKHRFGAHNKPINKSDSISSETCNVSETDPNAVSEKSDISFDNKQNEQNVPLISNNDSAINDDSPSDSSDSSIDSFYERTFEAIESALAEEIFRDSAIYSDHEENDISLTNGNEDYIDNHLESISTLNSKNKDSIYKSYEHLKCLNHNLNLLSGKRVKGAIIEKLRILEENARFQKDMNVNDFNGIKTIKERMDELEKWCTYKENIDSNDCLDGDNCESSPKGSPKPNSKGWVKHVIGKLQSDGQ